MATKPLFVFPVVFEVLFALPILYIKSLRCSGVRRLYDDIQTAFPFRLTDTYLIVWLLA